MNFLQYRKGQKKTSYITKNFASILAAAIAFSVSSAALAQQPRSFRVGILIPESGVLESQTIKGFRDGLRELGYKEGENLQVEMRDVKGDRAALKPAASELAGKNVDVIFATGTRATQSAAAATKKIPIVFRHDADPVEVGLVKSMKRPGENVTGVAAFSLQMTRVRLQILKEIVPNLQRLHIFYDPTNFVSKQNFALAQKTAATAGLVVVEHTIKGSDELKTSMSAIQKREGDALLHVPDGLVESQASYVFDAARQQGLPSMTYEEIWVTKGALAAYAVDNYEMGRQAAQLVDKILKGTNPKNLPVERARKFDLVFNLRTASVVGVNVPPQLLKKADRVIR